MNTPESNLNISNKEFIYFSKSFKGDNDDDADKWKQEKDKRKRFKADQVTETEIIMNY